MPIIGQADLATFLGLGANEDAARLAQFADGADAFFAKRTGRDWQQSARSGEKYRGNGTRYLVLRHYPVTTISSLTVDDVTIDVADDDEIDLVNPERGILMRTNGHVWPVSDKRNIVITYTGGPTVPKDLKLAALELAAYVYQTTGGRLSVSDGDVSATFAGLAEKGVAQLPMVIEALRDHADVLY